ncbi:synaptotagmin-like protein 1 isoform X1 [Rissa tridactyla]|uniref:synaptotagmin-like protein 1 isoform X1 n=1 Tax=Rissa tridactyla TaxID=75485 RepID=UPI0023BA4727|nr:synaptotagmin-like protein 1 isoform X1 [Rissa tridactyla]XP_054070181.1 synaptotagmin-like protein 1 isoform X1 [Rissa tridactyla]XP_054070182.1 synaptotagmin-like protein 1 isoform X1 [Rissa tridactyla]XP_054070183.1 synaptotagmin-like protein 1 isoform X1 [Rissa tridactyla]XP_054070185.1 synaptotagmin-like protein 1 isoform X1 [Rissa tridactyla]
MLDLSFLTEEEYEKLMKVLQRDAELKKKDGDRIRRIQGSIKDEKKKKFVTGEWFSEVKAKRFQEDLEGPDLLRASIRRKKGKLENEDTEQIRMGLESKAAPSPTFPEHAAGAGEERSSTPALDTAEECKILPKPKPRLSVPLPASHKRSSMHDVSSSESDTGTSPFVATTNSLHLSRKGHGVSPLPSKLSEDAMPQPSSAARGEAVDGTASTTVGPKTPPEETYAPSKIPVKRKPSRTFPRSEQLGNHVGLAENGLAKRELLASPRALTAEAESGQAVKQGVNYTISSMSNKEEDIGLDREHFKNLKNFWEKGADSVMAANVPEDPSWVEADGRQFKLCRSLSVQSGQGQNSEEKPGAFTKTRTPYKRTITLSSSEEEPSYVAPARKGSLSVIPRSTYAKSKGGLVTRNDSLSESNGKPPVPEEEKVAQRCSKKSRLPVRAPAVKIESPTKEVSGSTFEPEMPTDELIMAEERKHAAKSLASRVQILIEPVLTDGESEDEKEERSDLGTHDNMEINRELPEEKTCESSGKPTASEPAGEREAVQGTDSAVYSEEDGDHSPAAQALARANSINLAKSMVNIYTTTETYNKPHLISHQFLEPERVKELSRSSPLLLSETESDTASEISFQFNKHKKTPSIGSHSSDMASVSSVSGSVLSVYSGDFGSVDAQGTVEFALDYDEKNREFQVHVFQCRDLAVVDEKKGRSDPYVKTYLLPDKARMGKRKTSVKKRTVNPIYNEVLRYKIEKMVLLIQKLNLSVWHNDPLGRNSFLGEIEIDLASWDWSNRKLNWYPLKPRSLSAVNGVDHRGVMNLSIKYVPPGSLGPKNPPSGEVHIWVKDVKDLLQLRPSGVDSFVKCYVLPDTSKKSYQKTRVIKRDTNPVFNHTIVYDGFHTEDLKDACVELTVWDHEKLTNHFLGGIRLGLGTGLSYGISVDWMDSTQEEVAFWQEMMSAANEWIEGLLPLRSLAGRKKLK